MDNAGERAPAHLLGEDRQRVVLRIARVHDQRHLGLARRGDVRAEARLLPFPIGMIVIVIEAALPDPTTRGCRARAT
jgi:hypothetical protein